MENKYKVGDSFGFKENPTVIVMTIEEISDKVGDETVYKCYSLFTEDLYYYLNDSYIDEYYVKVGKTGQVGGSHYSRLKIDPYEYSMQNELNPLQMNAIKYITRYNFKNGIEDLKKAKHTIDRLIEYEEQKG